MKVIKYYRKRFNMTQKDLAEKLCVNENVISHYENGKRTPHITIIKKMAEVFTTDVKNLISPKKHMLIDNITNLKEERFDYLMKIPWFTKKEIFLDIVYYRFEHSKRTFSFGIGKTRIFYDENTPTIPFMIKRTLTPFEAPLEIRKLYIETFEKYLEFQNEIEYTINFYYLIPYIFLKHMGDEKYGNIAIKSEYNYSMRYYYCNKVFKTNLSEVYSETENIIKKYSIDYEQVEKKPEGMLITR